MKKTPLHQNHIKLGAKMVEFAGYEMPLSYKEIKSEYTAVREGCGIFDISHMAPIEIVSADPEKSQSLINHITCRDISELKPGEVQYNALMLKNGGLLDDITVFYEKPGKYFLVVNAANRENAIEYFSGLDASLKEGSQINETGNYAMIAVQGPESESIIQKALGGSSLLSRWNELYYYEFQSLEEMPYGFVSRTGYTGEDGFEIMLPASSGVELWEKLIQAGAMPCGLASRDLLRMEVFYPLYGNELNHERTPYESGLAWLVSPEKEFTGKEKVMAAKTNGTKRVRGFIMEQKGHIPRSGYKVLDQQGNEAGVVTSGGFSFQWGLGFGIAFLNKELSKNNTAISIEIRNQAKPAHVLSKSPHKGSIKKRDG